MFVQEGVWISLVCEVRVMLERLVLSDRSVALLVQCH